MMKKVLFSLLLVTSLAITATGQIISPIKISVKAGLNFSNLAYSGSDETGFSSITLFHVGAAVGIPLSEKLTLQPGLTLTGKGARLCNCDADGKMTPVGSVRNLYVELPVNLLANFKLGNGKIFAGGGPYYAMGIIGMIKFDDFEDENRGVEFGTGEDADFKRGDMGLNFLAGYALDMGLNIQAGYGLGLKNIASTAFEGAKIKNKVFSVGIGYSF